MGSKIIRSVVAAFLVLSTFFTLPRPAFSGQPLTWIGAVNSDWENGANWNLGIKPEPGDDVFVTAGSLLNEPEITATDVSIHNLTIEDGRTLKIGSGRTLTLGGFIDSSGVVTGTGTIHKQGGLIRVPSGVFNVAIEVSSGAAISRNSTLHGPVSVANGASLLVNESETLTVYGDMTVDGTLGNFGTGVAAFDFKGSSFINNGSVSGNQTLNFTGTGPQTVAGTGLWSIDQTMGISNTAAVSLANPLTFAAGSLNIASGGVLTVAYPLTVTAGTLGNSGSVQLASPLLLNGGNITLTNSITGTITGTAPVQIAGSATLTQSGTFQAPLSVISGTTQSSGGIFDGSISVAGGATLQVSDSTILTVNGDASVDGTLNLSGNNAQVDFKGASLTNNGSIEGTGAFQFAASGSQVVTGTGNFDAAVNVASGSTVSLGNDQTMSDVTVGDGGSLYLATKTLTVTSYSQAAGATLGVSLAGHAAGTEYGQLNASASATLDGALVADLSNGFIPTEDDLFQVLTFDTKNSAFNSITATGILSVTGVYTASALSLRVTGVYTGANLAIEQTAPISADTGFPLAYTLTVTNAGPLAASGVTVTDSLPGEVTYGSATGSGWDCGQATGVVTCTRPDLAPGPAPAINIVVYPQISGTITNTAIVTSTTLDTGPANNTVSASTLVTSHAPANVDIAGPSTGGMLTNYDFTATVSPLTTTLPITFVWQTADQEPITNTNSSVTDVVTLSWSGTGSQPITVTVTNALGSISATRNIAISAQPASVSLAGPAAGVMYNTYHFTATVSPLTATTPITYIWQATGQSPAMHTGGTMDDVSYTWNSAGPKTITVTASNPGGTVTNTHTVVIETPPPGSVSPAGGGTLTNSGATTTTVSFPPGAVSVPVTVTYTPTSTSGLSGNFQAVGTSFVIEARQADGSLVTSFAQPFTITVQYRDADVGGIDENSLKIYYWSTTTNSWVAVPTVVDPAANTLTATLDHLTKFALLGTPIQSQPSQWKLYVPIIFRNY